jgi:hypothetical protein
MMLGIRNEDCGMGRQARPLVWIMVFGMIAMSVEIGVGRAQSRSLPEIRVGRVFELHHRPAGDLLPLIYPLLSTRGTVLIEAGDNSLTIQDRGDILDQIAEVVATFDQPFGRVELKFRIVKAALGKTTASSHAGLPADLLVRLGELLRYRSFRLVAQRELEVEDREDVQVAVGSSYRVGFRLKSESPAQRIRLEGFQLTKAGADSEASSLIHTHLDIRQGKPMILGLAKTESSPEALVVVINYQESRGEG